MLRLIEIFLCFWVQVARRGGILLVLTFIAAAIGAGYYAAKTLKIDPDTTNMLSSDLEFQIKAAELRDAFPQIKSELSIIVRAPTEDEADAFAIKLSNQLKERQDLVTNVYLPGNDSFFRNNGLLFLSEPELEQQLLNLTKAAGLIETLYVDPGIDTLFSTLADNDGLAERSELGGATLDRIYNDLADTLENAIANGNIPFSWRGVLSDNAPPPGGYLRIINVTPVKVPGKLKPISDSLAGMRAEIATLNPQFAGRTTALITGTLALRGEELESVTTGIGYSFLLSFLMVSVLLIFAFRSVYVSLLTIVGLLITLSLTSAFAGWAFGELNLVSVAFTVLLVGLGLDFSIHLLLHVQEYRRRGHSVRVALNSTMREVGGAMALAAPTTSLAFLAFMPTSFDGIAQLGAVAGSGVIIAFFVSITFLPAVVATAPLPKPMPSSGAIRRGFSAFDKISIPIAVIVTFVALAGITLLPQARFDADTMSLRSKKSESVRAFNMLFDDKSTYPYRLTRILGSAEEVRETALSAKSVETVRSTRSLLDFIPEDQDAKLELIDFAAGSLAFVLTSPPGIRSTIPDGSGINAMIERLKQTGEEAQQSTARKRLLNALTIVRDRDDPQLLKRLDDQIFRFWPDLVNILSDQFDVDYVELDDIPLPIKNRYLTDQGEWRIDLLPAEDVRDPKMLRTYVNSVEARFPDIAGAAIQAQKAGNIIAQSMIQASLLALVVIAIVLLFFVQSPVTVLLMLFPLSLAAILTIATGVVFDIPFNYANVIVLPLLMGIGIDSGIHLVLRQEKAQKHGNAAGVYATATPRAVLFSALTTVASFGSLMLSDHRGTASMGKLLSISIGYTLLCTLIVLPAVFHLRDMAASRRKNTSIS